MRKGLLIGALVLTPFALLWYFYLGPRNTPANQAPLAELNAGSLATFQAEFNRAADEVRVVLLLSPT
jgi:hypothetical protein